MSILGIAFSVSVLVVLPLVPSHTQDISLTNAGTFFTSRSVDAIPNGSVVLTYPYPNAPIRRPSGRRRLVTDC